MSSDNQKLQQTAQAFEAIFLRDIIKSMRLSTGGEGLLENSGGNQFRDMMDDQLASDMSSNKGGLGIAEMLVSEWSKRS